MSWFKDIDNLTFLMAAIGFLYSVFDLIVTWIRLRESYGITVIDYAVRGTNVIQFLVCITNRSGSPLAIREISAFGTVCELKPKAIRGNPEKWNFQHTAEFPICIEGHGCNYAYLEFVAPMIAQNSIAPGIAVSFQIHSTRRRVRKTVILDQQSHYLHSREQSPAPQSQPQETDVCCDR